MKYIIKCSEPTREWYYQSYLLYDEQNTCWDRSISYARHMSLIRVRTIMRSIIASPYWITRINNELKLEILNVK